MMKIMNMSIITTMTSTVVVAARIMKTMTSTNIMLTSTFTTMTSTVVVAARIMSTNIMTSTAAVV